MEHWLCRWPNEEDADTVETARQYLRDGKFLATNGDCPTKGDLVVFRNSVNMRDNANKDRFSTFSIGVVSSVKKQEPPNWQYETRTWYISFEGIDDHDFEFEQNAFATWNHENWPNSRPNNQFMKLNERQRKELGFKDTEVN